MVLNEILASNQHAIAVGDRFPDYVELFNPSLTPISLAGATLSDDSVTTLPFTFPAGTSLAPGARLLIWCDQTPGLPQPHALLGIGSTGERITLRGPNGTVWDELAFGLQTPDLPLSRTPDGTGPWSLSSPTPDQPNPLSPLPLASNETLRINEWMAAPTTGDDWLELYNPAPQPANLSGLTLTDRAALPASNRPIPPLSFLAPGGFLQLFASDLRRSDANHLDFRLGAGGDQIILLASDRTTVLDRIQFGPQADGVAQGRTPDGTDLIGSFPDGQATPGTRNVRELTRVVISEILSHTDPPLEDAIELHNPTPNPIDISHWWLSDDGGEPRKFRIPPGSVLAPGGYAAFYQAQFGNGPTGFSLNSYEGDEVWLSTGDAAGNLTGERTVVQFGALPNSVPSGRVPTSVGFDFTPLTWPTFGVRIPTSLPNFRQGQGATNDPPRLSPVQLSEIHCCPTSDTTDGAAETFIELHNPGPQPVPLFDPAFPTNAWRLRGAARFDFPTNLTLPPASRLLVTRFDPATNHARLVAFRSAHNIPDPVPIFGPFTGNLASANTGLELQYPDLPEGPDKPRPGFVPYVRAERVDFPFAPPWPAPDSSHPRALHRRAPAPGVPTFSNDPAAWELAYPSPGRDRIDPASLDQDRDGLPDVWEREHGLDPQRHDAHEDLDQDGATNNAEFLAGTHPGQPTDVLRLQATLIPGETAIQLTFASRPNREYLLEERAGPSPNNAWSPLARIHAGPIPGPQSLRSPLTPNHRWFRVRLAP